MNVLIALSGLGILAMLAEVLRFRKALLPLMLAGLAVVFFLNMNEWGTFATYFKMMRYDNFAISFAGVIIAIVFLWFLLAWDYIGHRSGVTDYVALVLFSTVGAVVMVSYSNLSMLFLGIEILSLPVYVLAGSNKNNLLSNEAAFKYFLMGAFASGFLLFGIALLYGSTETLDIYIIAEMVKTGARIPSFFYAGILMVLVGLSFKVAAVPFHFWTPDVYQGSPTVVTTFMATVVKTAAFAAMFRLFYTCFATITEHWLLMVSLLAALTLVVGNITAAYQNGVKRLLAYSSVSHAGFLLLATLAVDNHAMQAVLFYSAAYAAGTLAAFTVLYNIGAAKGDDSLQAFSGLGKSNPWLAATMTMALLSLGGIPPFAGFFAKYYVLVSVIDQGLIWLAITGIASSAVGIYYYFRIISAMYTGNPSEEKISVSTRHAVLLIIATAAGIVLGLFPDLLIGLL